MVMYVNKYQLPDMDTHASINSIAKSSNLLLKELIFKNISIK